jgi:hypothetical protein
VIVRRGELAAHLAAVERHDGRPDTLIDAAALAAYAPVVDVPEGDYRLVGVDLGDASRNVPPADAVAGFGERTPLTIEEGLALLAADSSVIAANRGFSLAGSSRGDRRCPALWISKGAPKLGWCYLGAPHTWLGTASCAAREAL